jgi:signal transduction histidine kinase
MWMMDKSGREKGPSAVSSVFGKLLPAISRYNRIVLMFAVCCGVVVIGILALRDLQAANAEAREMYTRSVHGLKGIAEMQYEAQETRRCTLYALTTSDSNLQVRYADQSRDADQKVKNGIAEFQREADTDFEKELGNRLESEWVDYLHVRDEVLASILEGSTGEAVHMDLVGGVPAFERVRRNLLQVQRLYDEDAARRQADLARSSRRSSIKLICILSSTFLVATLAVVVIQRSRELNAIQLARLQMEFVASASHELRTPLAVLSCAADNLADGLVKGHEATVRYGGIVRRQSRQMSELVDQILLFASTEDRRLQPALEPVSATAIIHSILNKLDPRLQDAGFSIQRDIEPCLPPVLGNGVAIAQCLNSLIDNAVKYSGRSRDIELRAFAAPSEDGSVQELRIGVIDHGIGIDALDIPRIFEPFYRSPQAQAAQIHGMGLGLSLAKRIAESMGGRVSVKSDSGRGSVFTLHLQFARETAEEGTANAIGQRTEDPHA